MNTDENVLAGLDNALEANERNRRSPAPVEPVVEPLVMQASDRMPDQTHSTGPRRKLTEGQVVEALEKSHGLKGLAASLLGVSFSTLERYIRRLRDAQAVIEHWRIKRKDNAEMKLDEAIARGEPWAIAFTLKNARDREYNDKIDLTASGSLTSLTEEELLKRLAAVLRSKRMVIEQFIDVEVSDDIQSAVIDITPQLKAFESSDNADE